MRFGMSSVVGQILLVMALLVTGAVVLALGLANLWYAVRFVFRT
jgi:membrane protein implicated in regulation of membrane protease activity